MIIYRCRKSISALLTGVILSFLSSGIIRAQSYTSLEGGVTVGLVKCYTEVSLVKYLPHSSLRLFGGGGLMKELTQKRDKSAALIDPSVYFHSAEAYFMGEILGVDYRRYIASGAKHAIPKGFYVGAGFSTANLTNYTVVQTRQSQADDLGAAQVKKQFGAVSPDLSFGYQNVLPSTHFLVDIYGSVSCYCSYNLQSLGANDAFLGRSFALHISVGNLCRKIPVRPCPGPL
jgi:hypothetical protein